MLLRAVLGLGFYCLSALLTPNYLVTRTLFLSAHEVAPVNWTLIHPESWWSEPWQERSLNQRICSSMLVKQSLELFFHITEWSLCQPECRLSWSATRESGGMSSGNLIRMHGDTWSPEKSSKGWDRKQSNISVLATRACAHGIRSSWVYGLWAGTANWMRRSSSACGHVYVMVH